MTARLEPTEWIARLGFVFAAALLGLLAGYSPEVAVAAAIAVAFVILTMADLRIGLAMFVIIIFIETAEVAPGLGLAKVAGAALAFSWLALVLTDPDSRRFIWSDHPWITALLVAALTWAMISAVWAVSPDDAISQVTRYLLSAALFPIVYSAVRCAEDLRMVLIAFVIGAGASAVLGIVSPADPLGGADAQRLTSTIGDPNELAATLAAGFVISIGLAINSSRGSVARPLLIATGVVCVVALTLTISRGGILALAAALAVAPLFARRKLPTLAGAMALVGIFAIYLVSLAPPDTLDRLAERDGGSGRTDIWQVAWRVIEDRPVAGVGVGNFRVASVDYVLQPGALPFKRNLAASPTVAHNIYLEIWAELGFVGLVLFIGLFATCFGAAVLAFMRLKRRGDLRTAALAAAVALALVALLTAYFFLSEQTGNKFWLLLALCPSLLAVAKSRNVEADETPD